MDDICVLPLTDVRLTADGTRTQTAVCKPNFTVTASGRFICISFAWFPNRRKEGSWRVPLEREGARFS